MKVDDKINDAYFKAENKAAKAKDITEGDKQEKEPLSAERKADQESIDKAILAIVKKTDYMKGYLQTRFTLTNGVYPHAISF